MKKEKVEEKTNNEKIATKKDTKGKVSQGKNIKNSTNEKSDKEEEINAKTIKNEDLQVEKIENVETKNQKISKEDEQIERIKKVLKEEQIKNIYLMFVDFSGNLLTKMVGVDELIRNTHVSWFDGISLNGSLIEDFKDEKDSDWLVLLPDPYSFRKITFLDEKMKKAGMIFCDIKNYALDTRGILKKAVSEFLDLEITPMFGTQSIYAILGEQQNQNFYQTLATNPNTIFHNKIVNYLLEAGIEIEYYMPYGKKHQRIDLVPDIATISADKLFTAKWYIQNLGLQEEKKISFENIDIPNLSTCPVHMSLWQGKHEKNLFFDEKDKYELSDLGKKFIKGILKHNTFIKKVIRATTNYQIKQYKNQLSVQRDECIMQVPLYFKEKQKQDRIGWSKRCIYNGLNADNNFYLVFACLLYAGLYGIFEQKETSQEYFKEKLGEEVIQKIRSLLDGEQKKEFLNS